MNNIDPNGLFKIKTWVLSAALDVLFTVMNAAASAGFISVGVSIKILARNPFTRKAAEDLITKKVIPTFIFGFMNPLMTILRKAIWRVAGVSLSFGQSYLTSLLEDVIPAHNLTKKIYNIHHTLLKQKYKEDL